MPVEMKMQYKGLATKSPELVITINILPRGSGNRNKARELAEYMRRDSNLGPHIGKIVAGASRVTAHLPITRDMQKAIDAFLAERKQQQQEDQLHDLPGQLPLAFG